jgi:hypothetical protein
MSLPLWMSPSHARTRPGATALDTWLLAYHFTTLADLTFRSSVNGRPYASPLVQADAAIGAAIQTIERLQSTLAHLDQWTRLSA